MLILICCIVLLTAVDQLTKLAAVKLLGSGGSVKVINNFFYLTYVENKGAAFGIMQGGKWIFIIITAAVIVIAAVYYIKTTPSKQNRLMRIAVALVVSGAVGNAVDRLFRGFVVDFLYFRFFGHGFPVFNFADILVVVGTLMLAAAIIFADVGGKENV